MPFSAYLSVRTCSGPRTEPRRPFVHITIRPQDSPSDLLTISMLFENKSLTCTYHSFCQVLYIFRLIVHRRFLRVEMGDCFWVAEDSASVTKRSRYLKHQSVLLHPFFEACTRVTGQYLLGNTIEPRGGGRPIKARCVHAETNSVEGLVDEPY